MHGHQVSILSITIINIAHCSPHLILEVFPWIFNH